MLVLDRGYPAAWLVALLIAHGIRFVMRCDNDSGWVAGKSFMRSAQDEAWVRLNRPSADEVRDWGCPAQAPRVRLVRQTAPNGAVRVLATNLDSSLYPYAVFADLYHQRWRIEEAFKRLKHRLSLEHVSGLSQLAVVQDVAAKVLCDNLQALATLEARDNDDLPDRQRINRAYVHTALKPLLPALLLGRKVARLLRNVLRLIAKQTYLHRENLSKPRKPGPKPHKYMTQNHC